MSVITNKTLDVKSYVINFNFVQSTSNSSDRLSVLSLYDAEEKELAEIHFRPDSTGFTVSEYSDYVVIQMSSEHFDSIYQVLRNERPIWITFLRNDNGVLNNVWLGTFSLERVGEEERRGIRWPQMIAG